MSVSRISLGSDGQWGMKSQRENVAEVIADKQDLAGRQKGNDGVASVHIYHRKSRGGETRNNPPSQLPQSPNRKSLQ